MAGNQHISLNAPLITEEDRRIVDGVLRSGWIGTGSECEAFEAELRDYLGAAHVVCVSSCTSAIELMLDHARIDHRSRVAVPAWTFPATACPVALRGAEVVLVDCDPDTLLVDPTSLAAALDVGVDAVIPVHFGGLPLPRAIIELATARGAIVIEDAAHAFGASDEYGFVRGTGSVGAAFSFHATKNLTCGEGGAIATEDDSLANFVRAARTHGVDRDAWTRRTTGTWTIGDVELPGRKANLPDLLAGLGRSQLRTFDERQRHRKKLTTLYRERLSGIDGLTVLPAKHHHGNSDHLMILALPAEANRAAVVDGLARRGIGTGLHYRPLHHLTWFGQHAAIAPGGLPACDDLAGRALTLPLHSALSLKDVDVVVDSLAEIISEV